MIDDKRERFLYDFKIFKQWQPGATYNLTVDNNTRSPVSADDIYKASTSIMDQLHDAWALLGLIDEIIGVCYVNYFCRYARRLLWRSYKSYTSRHGGNIPLGIPQDFCDLSYITESVDELCRLKPYPAPLPDHLYTYEFAFATCNMADCPACGLGEDSDMLRVARAAKKFEECRALNIPWEDG